VQIWNEDGELRCRPSADLPQGNQLPPPEGVV
jgi:hypothetical protein